MNERPRGIYSPSPPSGLPARTTAALNLNTSATNLAIHQTAPLLPSKILKTKPTSFDIGKHHQIPKTSHFSKRNRSKSLLRFESETKRNSRKKRRYSDVSELKSSRIRLNSLETDRSVSPHNKRRRISDISDLFQTDQHSDYKVQGIVTIFDADRLKRHNLQHFTSTKPKIRVIINAQNVIVAITKGGLGAAFNRRDLKLLCYLNEHKDEEINSLFHNKCDNSFIVVSTFESVTRLRIRSIPLRHIELGKFKGFEIFEKEAIFYPGWMEYDDVKDRILTYNHVTRFFKLWDLNDYSLIYSFCNVSIGKSLSIEDVKITNDGLVECSPVREPPMKRDRRIRIRSLNEDKILTQFEIKVPARKGKGSEKEEEKESAESQDFLEYHHGYLYVKHEENAFLNVYDCRDRAKAPKILNQFKSPDAYLFLKRCNRLLYFKESVDLRHASSIGHYGVLDLVNGENIRLSQHIENANHRESVMFVTKNQTKIIYYSKFRNAERNSQKEGIIQINSLETGQLFGWIMCDEEMMHERTPLNHRWCLSPTVNKRRENILIDKNPLKQVTAIGYDDVQNEIYVGTRSGNIYVWA